MKIKTSLTAGLLPLMIAGLLRADDPAPQVAVPQISATPASSFSDAQVAEQVGWLVATRGSLTQLQFTPAETEALVKGFSEAMAGKTSPYELQKIEPQLTALMQRKQTAFLARMKSQSQGEADSFFTKLKDDKNVIELPSGLRYEIVKPGEGLAPKPNETVSVNYTGRLLNGTVFDSSVQRGQPAEFQLDQVISGWTEGLQKISKGGKIKLYIPASLAYGDEGRPGIPPGSALIFDVELLDVKPSAPPPK